MLLAYAAGGGLPNPAAPPYSRRTPGKSIAANPPIFAEKAVLHDAACRIVKQELELLAELLARCRKTYSQSTGSSLDDVYSLLANVPDVICEHMEA